MTRRLSAWPLVGLALLAVTGCVYQPGDEASPWTRRATWFSFIAGDDLRAACRPGAPDRFRIIYNGNWSEQVRIYQVGADEPRVLEQRVIEQPSASEFSLSDPLAPWRGTAKSLTLSDEEYAVLLHHLEQSGAYRSPDATLTLAADQFYWLAASCHDGTFHLAAWLYPSDAFAHASFVTWLTAIDTTGIPVNPPRPWPEVATTAGGTGSPYATTTLPRQLPPTGTWSIGIAHDRLIDQLNL